MNDLQKDESKLKAAVLRYPMIFGMLGIVGAIAVLVMVVWLLIAVAGCGSSSTPFGTYPPKDKAVVAQDSTPPPADSGNGDRGRWHHGHGRR